MHQILITTSIRYYTHGVAVSTTIAEFSTREEALMAISRINGRSKKEATDIGACDFSQNAMALNF